MKRSMTWLAAGGLALSGCTSTDTPAEGTPLSAQAAALTANEVASTHLDELAKALNSLGVTPRDMVVILQAIRAAGALDADLEVLQHFIGPDPLPKLPAGEVPGASGHQPRAGSGSKSPRRPLQASNATSLAQYIQWASTAVVGAASRPASRMGGAGIGESQNQGNIPLPDLPPTLMDPTDDIGPLVW
jgi:hypothetical protein